MRGACNIHGPVQDDPSQTSQSRTMRRPVFRSLARSGIARPARTSRSPTAPPISVAKTSSSDVVRWRKLPITDVRGFTEAAAAGDGYSRSLCTPSLSDLVFEHSRCHLPSFSQTTWSHSLLKRRHKRPQQPLPDIATAQASSPTPPSWSAGASWPRTTRSRSTRR